MVVFELHKWLAVAVVPLTYIALYIKGCFMGIHDFIISKDTKGSMRRNVKQGAHRVFTKRDIAALSLAHRQVSSVYLWVI
jgi:hypothetical protein